MVTTLIGCLRPAKRTEGLRARETCSWLNFLGHQGTNVKTIQGLLRHAKVIITLTCIRNPLTPPSLKRKKTLPWRSQAPRNELVRPHAKNHKGALGEFSLWVG